MVIIMYVEMMKMENMVIMMKMKVKIMLLDKDYGDEMIRMEIMVIMLTMKMMIMIDAYYVDDDDDYYVDEYYDYEMIIRIMRW
jgi:hypothetical protein